MAHEPMNHGQGLVIALQGFDEDGEFIATQTGGDIVLPQTGADPIGYLAQGLIAAGVTKGVVDDFEIIKSKITANRSEVSRARCTACCRRSRKWAGWPDR